MTQIIFIFRAGIQKMMMMMMMIQSGGRTNGEIREVGWWRALNPVIGSFNELYQADVFNQNYA